MKPERDGYYWVKTQGSWDIAKWSGEWNLWFFCSDDDDSLPSGAIEIIGPEVVIPQGL